MKHLLNENDTAQFWNQGKNTQKGYFYPDLNVRVRSEQDINLLKSFRHWIPSLLVDHTCSKQFYIRNCISNLLTKFSWYADDCFICTHYTILHYNRVCRFLLNFPLSTTPSPIVIVTKFFFSWSFKSIQCTLWSVPWGNPIT